METNVISQQQPVGTRATPAPQSGSVLSSDFETFLKMLTAQAQYQDPLEPIRFRPSMLRNLRSFLLWNNRCLAMIF